MYRITICTVAYPQPELRVRQFAQAAARAVAAMPDAAILIVAEARYPRPDLGDLQTLDTRLHYVDTDAVGAAALRGKLFAAARRFPTEGLMFIDYDDMIIADALPRMSDALSSAPIAYGDLLVTDENGNSGSTLAFGADELPSRIDQAEMLFDGNCLGLSNTAVRRDILLEEDERVPAGLVAVDWWLFTRLLLRGHAAVAVEGPVAAYRQYAGNTLGAQGKLTLAGLQGRLAALQAHYRSFAPAEWARQRLDLVVGCDGDLAALMQAVQARNGSRWWFGNVMSAAQQLARK